MGRMTLTEKEYLKKRVGQEFDPILAALRDRLIPTKQRIEQQLFKKLGLAAVETKVKKLVAQVEALNKQFKEVTGTPCVDVTFKKVTVQESTSWSNGHGNHNGKYTNTPYAREVEAKVKSTREATHLVQAEADLKKLQDNVMLAGFPEQVTELMTVELPKLTERFRKLAGLNGNGAKQLTS